MKKFLHKITVFSLIGFIPFGVLTAGYVYFDPFQVLKKHKNTNFREISPNRDYVSTEMFLKNYNQYQYNSFVFGSSRTLAYKPLTWYNYLNPDAKIFMFDAANESIYGIYKKIKFLEARKVILNNILIILCHSCSFENDTNQKGYLFIKHPLISEESAFKFQLEFYKTYLNPRYFLRFYDYIFSGKYKKYMKSYFEFGKTTIDSITNQMCEIDHENELKRDFNAYYKKRNAVFYNRNGEKKDNISRINKKHLFMLQEIKRILKKHKTNYKVILSPLYDQVRFNKTDLILLKNTFGNNLFDYSGKNTFTYLKTNYYEDSHYKPCVGDSILKQIYNIKNEYKTNSHWENRQ